MVMAKDMLFNNYWTYIASGSGSQAEQTFTTLERIANDNIDTMLGSTGYIFKAEIEIKNAAGDGLATLLMDFHIAYIMAHLLKHLIVILIKKEEAW